MARDEFQKNLDRTRHQLVFHRALDIVVKVLTLGVCSNKSRVKKWRERYDKSQSEFEKYTSLVLAIEKLDKVDETITIEGVRVSKHTFSDLPTIGPEDYGPEWILIRDRVLTRDSYRCQEEDGCCYGPLQIHHKTPLSRGGSNELGNLTTLCFYHHCLKHEHMRRNLHGNIRC